MSLTFFFLAGVTLAGAVMTMTLRMLVHSVLALIVALGGLAALYIELGAQFVGLAQVLVYIGAIAILIVFAILLTREGALSNDPGRQTSRGRFALPNLIVSSCVSLLVFVVLAWAVVTGISPGAPGSAPEVTVKQIGTALLAPYVLPLEVIGLMLTAALIGAVILALEPALEESGSAK